MRDDLGFKIPASNEGPMNQTCQMTKSNVFCRDLVTEKTHPTLNISINLKYGYTQIILSYSHISSADRHFYRVCCEYCCERERNDGILECWNAGFHGKGSIFV